MMVYQIWMRVQSGKGDVLNASLPEISNTWSHEVQVWQSSTGWAKALWRLKPRFWYVIVLKFLSLILMDINRTGKGLEKYPLLQPATYTPGFTGGSDSEESARNMGNVGSISGSERSSGEGNGNPLQYSCLENPHRQRNLAGYSLWGLKESDMTEWLTHPHLHPSMGRMLNAPLIIWERHTVLVIFG